MKTTKEQERCIETVLQMEGVMAKGYGCVAKFAMQDQALRITAKGLYAYLCSLSGGGAVTWPSRKTILGHIQLGKDAYYSSLKQLIDEGYLAVTKRRLRGQTGKWCRNIYTIVMNPKRFQDAQNEGMESEGQSTIRAGGMMAQGFGMIPRLPMQDGRLSIREKAMYAYFLTYASAGTAAFPRATVVQRHLKITDETYRLYIKHLEQLGYITRTRRRNRKGQYGVYDYYISLNPEVQDAEVYEPPRSEPDTVESDKGTVELGLEKEEAASTRPGASEPDTVKHDKRDRQEAKPPRPEPDTVESDKMSLDKLEPVMAEPDTDHPDTAHPDTANPDTNLIPTLSNTNSFYYQDRSITTSTDDGGAGGSAEAREQLCQDVLDAGGIPLSYLGDKEKTIAALHLLCGYGFRKEHGFYDRQHQEAYLLVVKALEQLCCRPSSKVADGKISRKNFVELLNDRCMERYGKDVDMECFIDTATEEYMEAIQLRKEEGDLPLKKPVNYARYVVWTTLQTYQPLEEQPFIP